MKLLLVPELADKITACHETTFVHSEPKLANPLLGMVISLVEDRLEIRRDRLGKKMYLVHTRINDFQRGRPLLFVKLMRRPTREQDES